MDALRPNRWIRAELLPGSEQLIGKNTYVEVSVPRLKAGVGLLLEAILAGGAGTRVTVSVPEKHASWLGRRGFKREHPALVDGHVFMSAGRRRGGSRVEWLDYRRCDKYLDARDKGLETWADGDKRNLAWREVRWEPDLWRGKGLPLAVEEIMTQGAKVELHRAIVPRDLSLIHI